MCEEYGITPLEFMLNMMKDKSMPVTLRYAAAKDAANYVHPKLANVTVKGDPKQPLSQTVTNLTPSQLRDMAKTLLKEV